MDRHFLNQGLAALTAVGVCAFGFTPGADAQVRSVQVTQNGTETLQLAEVLAFQSGTGTNVASQANGGVATATSSAFGTEPGDANDANPDGNFGNGSVWHSEGTTGETLTVTFNADYAIDNIQLFGRTDCCTDRDNNLTVRLLDAAGGELFSTMTGIPDDDAEVTIAVPEPTSLGLAGLGVLGLLARRPRRR